MVPEAFREVYTAARRGAGLIDRADRARIVVSGRDRASYLHGLLTNDITALEAGGGCYAAYLTPQGRMITDLWVYELGDVMLLALGAAKKATLLAKLDQFLFSEDVQLGDVTGTFVSLAIVGPEAARIVVDALQDVPASELIGLAEHGNLRARFAGQPAIVLRVTDTGEPGYEILVDSSQGDALRTALRASGGVDVDSAVADALRIEAGIPRFGRDMDEDTIPLEAGIESRAISLTKGCYVGQEVIIRVLHRGHGRVARKLVGLTFEGEIVPAEGATVDAVDPVGIVKNADSVARNIGRTTSSSMSPSLERPIALAYLHRDFLAPGTPVSVNGVGGVVTALPFIARTAAESTPRLPPETADC